MADAVQQNQRPFDGEMWAVPPASTLSYVAWIVMVTATRMILAVQEAKLRSAVLATLVAMPWTMESELRALEASGTRQDGGTSGVAKATPIDHADLVRLYLAALAIVLDIMSTEIMRAEARAIDEAGEWVHCGLTTRNVLFRPVTDGPSRPIGSGGFGG